MSEILSLRRQSHTMAHTPHTTTMTTTSIVPQHSLEYAKLMTNNKMPISSYNQSSPNMILYNSGASPRIVTQTEVAALTDKLRMLCQQRDSIDSENKQLRERFMKVQHQLYQQNMLLNDIYCTLASKGFSALTLPNGDSIELNEYRGNVLELVSDNNTNLLINQGQASPYLSPARSPSPRQYFNQTNTLSPASALTTSERRQMFRRQQSSKEAIMFDNMANSRHEQLCLLADLIGMRDKAPFVDDYINWLQTSIAVHPHTAHLRRAGVDASASDDQISSANMPNTSRIQTGSISNMPAFVNAVLNRNGDKRGRSYSHPTKHAAERARTRAPPAAAQPRRRNLFFSAGGRRAGATTARQAL